MQVLLGRGLRGCLILTCVVLMFGCKGQTETTGAKRPAIVLITVDGLLSDELAAFDGALELKALEQLIADGVAWPRSQSAVPMTRPAVASYLTGLAPDRHAVRDDIFTPLSAEIPTLAERLKASGYRTAGFPDNAFLGEDSGLWRGFEIVDAPPPLPLNAARWMPRVRPIDKTAKSVSAWLDTLGSEEPWFAWVHLSYPLVAQFKQKYFIGPDAAAADAAVAAASEGHSKGKGKGKPPAESQRLSDPEREAAARKDFEDTLQQFDQELGELLAQIRSRAGENVLILLAGTLADQRGSAADTLPGLGYSLQPSALEVPVVASFPVGTPGHRDVSDAVWSLDVAATIADVAGVALDERAEGVSLLDTAAADRVRYSFSWALLDQMGWRELALARQGELAVETGNPANIAGDSPAEQALLAELAGRAHPQPHQLAAEIIEPLLAKHGIKPQPYAIDGRDVADVEMRDKVAGWIWLGRSFYQRNRIQHGGQLMNRTVRFKDSDNFGARVDRGQMMSTSGIPGADEFLEEALAFRPGNADAWHWYAHSIWTSSWQDAEEILLAIQPHIVDQRDVLYDLACTRSLANDVESSADYLERAWIAGYRDRSHIGADTDLRNLRASGKLDEVLGKFE